MAANPLSLESLECREVPAGLQVEQFGSFLRVLGTEGADQIVIRQQDSQVMVLGAAPFWSDATGDVRDRVPLSMIKYMILDGRGGDDTIRFENFDRRMADKLIYMAGGAGNDQLFGCGLARNLIDGGAGDDLIRGGKASDATDATSSPWSSRGDVLAGGAGHDDIEGGSGDDVLAGDASIGGAINWGTGAATLQDTGFLGNDTLVAVGGSDKAAGNGGADRFILADGARGEFDGGDGDDTFILNGGHCRIKGGAGANELTLRGTHKDDVFTLLGDARQLTATRAGLDLAGSGITRVSVLADGGDDVVNGKGLAVSLYADGGLGDDTLTGGSADDQLFGRGGLDRLSGGRGSNYLDGGGEAGDTAAANTAGVDYLARKWAVDGGSLKYDQFAKTGVSSSDIRQGADAKTCYLMSALGAAARDTDLSANIRHTGDGLYEVKLYLPQGKGFREVWQEVRFTGTLSAADPRPVDAGEFWTVLYQRAILKLTGANPGQAGSAGRMMEMITGRAAVSSLAGTWAPLLDAFRANPNTRAVMDTGNLAPSTGLIGLHSYVIDKIVFDAKGQPVAVRLANPHGVGGEKDLLKSNPRNFGKQLLTWAAFTRLAAGYHVGK